MTRALIIGAPRSGSGKTSVTIGLLRAFARRGFRVRGVKSGPDYIDPGFHQAATGLSGLNLDSWAMEPDLVAHLLAEAAEDTDLLLIESAMGLFDGIAGGEGRTGAAADLSRLLGIPVLLVLDVSGQSQTAAAVAVGFRHYDPAVKMAAVVLNRAGSERHVRLSKAAIEVKGLSVVGAVMRDSTLSLPERHLGLVQASEHPAIQHHIDRLADVMEQSLDPEPCRGYHARFRLDICPPAAARPAHCDCLRCGLHLSLSASRPPLASGRCRTSAVLAACERRSER
jgi:cobyrinic acid a,c-diamide synthase